jgi:hypothetical protein
MQELIKEEFTGVAELYLQATIKAWNNYFSLYHGKDKYVLVKFVEDVSETEEAVISEEQAKQLISDLKLISVEHATNKDLTVYETEESIRLKISGMGSLIHEKEQEVEEIRRTQNLFHKALRAREIEEKTDFDVWKEAKKKLYSLFDYDVDHISDEYKERLKHFEADFWKIAMKGELSYEYEYLTLLQYHLITAVNAEFGRSHGKGTFGYWLRGITQEEHDQMQKIERKNFNKYLDKCGYDDTEAFEGVSQDGQGGWHFEERENK